MKIITAYSFKLENNPMSMALMGHLRKGWAIDPWPLANTITES